MPGCQKEVSKYVSWRSRTVATFFKAIQTWLGEAHPADLRHQSPCDDSPKRNTNCHSSICEPNIEASLLWGRHLDDNNGSDDEDTGGTHPSQNTPDNEDFKGIGDGCNK